MNRQIYMDHHATTPVDNRVIETMLPYFNEKFGNAASLHGFGRAAANAVEQSRTILAESIGAQPREIVFTSGATEANNLALKGVLDHHRSRGNHIIVSSVEHKAVLDTASALSITGIEITTLPVDPNGLLDLGVLERSISDKTVLVSVIAAGNEVGTIQPIREIGQIARQHGVFFHTDATQAVGRIPINVEADNIDLLSFSAHKMYGPKGIGALFVRGRNPRVRLAPQIHGGGHERGMRSGTLPVPLIVGFGEAARIAMQEMPTESERLASLRDRLLVKLRESLDDIQVNGTMAHRLPNNLNVSFAHVEGEALLLGLPEVALSSGSACSSAEPESSHVLKALGVSQEMASSAIRFGLGHDNTEDDIDYVVQRIVENVKRLREMSPLYVNSRTVI